MKLILFKVVLKYKTLMSKLKILPYLYTENSKILLSENKTEINGDIYHVIELEVSILLRC